MFNLFGTSTSDFVIREVDSPVSETGLPIINSKHAPHFLMLCVVYLV